MKHRKKRATRTDQAGVSTAATSISKPTQQLVWLLVAAVAAYGLYQAIALTWISDDAFISFRYARNLIDGHGLVFNAGERVEGYTNFLWTTMIAAGMLVNLEPILFSRVLSIAAYLFTAFVFVYLSIRVSREIITSKPLIIPLTATALLLQYDFQAYATSGLETALTTALVTLGFAVLVAGNSRRSFLLAGLILTLAALTRPDAMIFCVMAVPYILLLGRPRCKNLLYYLLPLAAIYLPYWIIRYSYYGYPFPNTYYAKSASLPYYSQGLTYLWLYVKTYYVLLLLIPAVVIVLPRLFGHFLRERHITRQDHRAWLLGVLFIVPYVFYVVRTGGDFMFARFLIPVTPICLFFMEVSLMSLRLRIFVRAGIVLLIVAGVFFRWNQFVPEKAVVHGITDERAHYPPEVIRKAEIDGEQLRRYLGDVDVTVGFYGAKAMLIYYSELPMAIECDAGLTDTYIAHLPLARRGRPGHEKRAPYDYLLKRKVNFIFKSTLPNQDLHDQLRAISFSGLHSYIVVYENRVMDALKAHPDVQFVDFPAFLDQYMDQIGSVPDDRLRADLHFFKTYYFDYNHDPERVAALLHKLDVKSDQ